MSSINLEYENESNPNLVASKLDESIEMNINNDEMSIAKIENHLLNWNIPKQNIKNIYYQKAFDFGYQNTIKTQELIVFLKKRKSRIKTIFSTNNKTS